MSRRIPIYPLPEAVKDERYEIREGRGMCLNEERILYVPLTGTARSRRVQAHELAHARWSPQRPLAPKGVPNAAMQRAEDLRMNLLTVRVGAGDVLAAPIGDDEPGGAARFYAGFAHNRLSAYTAALATVRTGDYEGLLGVIESLNPQFAEEAREVAEAAWASMDAIADPTFEDAIRLAARVTQLAEERNREEQEREQPEPPPPPPMDDGDEDEGDEDGDPPPSAGDEEEEPTPPGGIDDPYAEDDEEQTPGGGGSEDEDANEAEDKDEDAEGNESGAEEESEEESEEEGEDEDAEGGSAEGDGAGETRASEEDGIDSPEREQDDGGSGSGSGDGSDQSEEETTEDESESDPLGLDDVDLGDMGETAVVEDLSGGFMTREAEVPEEEIDENRASMESIKGLTSGARWVTTPIDPAPMEITNPPRPKRLPPRLRARRKVAQTEGTTPRWMNRYCSDGAIFGQYAKRPGGGTVVIDASGTMSVTGKQIQEVMEALPAAKIATYCGTRAKGELRIVARDGRRVADDQIKPCKFIDEGAASQVENVVDLPVLEWLAREQEPRIWVSDGKVTGRGGRCDRTYLDRCKAAGIKGRVLRLPTMKDLTAWIEKTQKVAKKSGGR